MLETILSQPLTQLLGIALIAGLLQRMGIDVGGIVRGLFSKANQSEKTPEWAGRLLQYFNHDTTEHHERTHTLLEKMSNQLDAHNRLEEGNRSKLDEILKYGVPCSKEK